LNLIRHIPFLKAVAAYALTAIGGPTAHIGVMTKTFVHKRKDVTQQELTDIFSFCQMLPGPSSTQTITLIGYKRGGIRLAILTLLIWIAPACLLMGALAYAVPYLGKSVQFQNIFKYIQPMAIGFLCYAAWQAMRHSVTNYATYGVMLGAFIISSLFRSPWVFPVVLVIAGSVTNISTKRIATIAVQPRKINWFNIWLFVFIFFVAGICSEYARVHHWHNARLFNLFENFYRFGSLVWGGGHALMPVMYDQFIALPKHRLMEPFISYSDFLTGFGMMNCIPGPVFSVCSYIGGISMHAYGWLNQILGSVVGIVGVFLPSTLLVLFLYPIYNNIKQHTIIYRALEGITAAIIGIMWASGLLLLRALSLESNYGISTFLIILSTFFLLRFTKMPSPVIVLLFLICGYWF
jgi:chromate transporter